MPERKPAQGYVKMIIIGGFLGAGKTTTMVRVAQMFEASGQSTGIILNDQGDQLVDTKFGQVQDLRLGEVTGGCFCCQFDDLVSTTADLVTDRQVDIVLAEAVGSCTDLNATVIRPLRKYYGERFMVAPLTVLVDPRRWQDLAVTVRDVIKFGGNGDTTNEELVSYLFRKQLEEAHVIALNKTDLLQNEELTDLRQSLQEAFPSTQVVAISAETGAGLDQLLELWSVSATSDREADSATARILDIDYQKYADAEAALAWINTTLKVRGRGEEGLRPAEWVGLFLSKLGTECGRRGYAVGHAKAQLSTQDGWTKASLVRAGDEPMFSSQQWTSARDGELLINARIEADPHSMQEMVEDIVDSTNDALKTESEAVHMQCFSPTPPTPTHRFA